MKIIISCLSLSSFFQQLNRKKKYDKWKTNGWGTPSTENKGKYFSLIPKLCLCRQTLTVVYTNKPIPPQLNQECWSPKQIFGLQLTLKHCARISKAVKPPLNSFPCLFLLHCDSDTKQDCSSQEHSLPELWGLEWDESPADPWEEPWQHMGPALAAQDHWGSLHS